MEELLREANKQILALKALINCAAALDNFNFNEMIETE